MERMQCDNCGHVYDKDEGDPKNNVAPGTAWADVPADYKCPECGAGKDKFIIEQNKSYDLYKLGGKSVSKETLFFCSDIARHRHVFARLDRAIFI